ncbi:MAG: 7-cyano-7-deazaguanine synthase QueC [Syntrophobacterales bacterium]|nr:7-cyano-7-deazaguanine synthase QueC [Syntrophobacterales bacterium]
MKKAVVLLSGGIDSSTTLAIAKSEGYDLYALTFQYSQRHRIEIEAAKAIARLFDVKKHLIIDLPLDQIGGSALVDKSISVPKDRSLDEISSGIPITYVPARNTIFLSFAVAWAEVLETGNIFIGANVLDYSGYPDCRPEYIEAFEKMANLGTRRGVEGEVVFRIHRPLINLTKAQIIRKGLELGVDYRLTKSCYDPDEQGRACGRCDSCLLRKKGFTEAGVADPTEYR